MSLKNLVASGLAALTLAGGMASCGDSSSRALGRYTGSKGGVSRYTLVGTVFGYLSNPRFSNADFLSQISGSKAKFELLDERDGMVYFSIPARDYSKDDLSRLVDLSKLEFGKTSDGKFEGKRVLLGNYVLRKPGSYFFRFPMKDFKINPSAKIKVDYDSASYSADLHELSSFLGNKSIYGGYMGFYAGSKKTGREIIPNHGAFVARGKESSLERLVNQLVSKTDRKEDVAQKLLDFVTKEVRYNYREAISPVEVLKRPNEVLMTKESDCSGKVILYASLLEQRGIDYLLVYFKDHIAVAVEGDFEASNGLSFKWGGKVYNFAETTVRGYEIGRTRLKGIDVKDILFVQKPSEGKILDAKTGKALKSSR